MNFASDLQANDTSGDDREKDTPDSSKATSQQQAIVAFPLSYKLPNDAAIASTSSGRKRRTSEPPEGWICEPRTRKNGVIDKFYYHMETNIRCRSLKEVERYSLHGIRPGPKAKELEREMIEKKAKEEQISLMMSTDEQTRKEGMAGGKNKGKSKVHTEPNKNEEHKAFVEKVLAEAWHNMMHPTDIKTQAWKELEMKQKEEDNEENKMEMKLREEREKMTRKFKEERKELERKFEEERAQLHQWMKDEIDYRIQLQLDSVLPTILQGKDIPPTPGDSAGI